MEGQRSGTRGGMTIPQGPGASTARLKALLQISIDVNTLPDGIMDVVARLAQRSACFDRPRQPGERFRIARPLYDRGDGVSDFYSRRPSAASQTPDALDKMLPIDGVRQVGLRGGFSQDGGSPSLRCRRGTTS